MARTCKAEREATNVISAVELDPLRAQARQLAASEPFRRAVLRCCPTLADVDPWALDMDVHPNDQMLNHSLAEHRDPAAALSQYFNIGLQQFHVFERIASRVFDAGGAHLRVLDFACGYGRLLRFLVRHMVPGQLVAAELQEQAVSHVQKAYGVRTLQSTAHPAAFVTDERFDLIWVASLFSHLPEALFREWLLKLTGLLAPGGILCFSARDEVLLPKGEAMPAAGILFRAESENAGLPREQYGTTWVTESFVAGCVRDSLGDGSTLTRLPRMLANEQDLYVLSCKADDSRLRGLETLRRGTWGWLDHVHVRGGGRFTLEGWAGSLDGPGMDAVEVTVDGATERISPDVERPDVAAAFDAPWMVRSGWRHESVLRRDGPAMIEIVAPDPESPALIYAGWLHAPSVLPATKRAEGGIAARPDWTSN